MCVGRNYARHAKELGNPVPNSPLLFIKPATSAVPMAEPIRIPRGRGACHHEIELALLIGAPLVNADPEEVQAAIWGFGVGLDLTLRDLQDRLKAKGHPWERAKAFDGACPLSPFQKGALDWQDVRILMKINGEVRQEGHTRDMLFPVLGLVAHMSACFTISPGDVILTGTPEGVGPLVVGDRVECGIVGHASVQTVID